MIQMQYFSKYVIYAVKKVMVYEKLLFSQFFTLVSTVNYKLKRNIHIKILLIYVKYNRIYSSILYVCVHILNYIYVDLSTLKIIIRWFNTMNF